MNKIFEHWWKKHNRCFSIINYRKSWKENGNKPRISFRTNGAKKKIKEDICFDCILIIGYIMFTYTNFDY